MHKLIMLLITLHLRNSTIAAVVAYSPKCMAGMLYATT